MCLQPIIELLNVRVLHSLPVFTSFEVYLAQLSAADLGKCNALVCFCTLGGPDKNAHQAFGMTSCKSQLTVVNRVAHHLGGIACRKLLQAKLQQRQACVHKEACQSALCTHMHCTLQCIVYSKLVVYSDALYFPTLLAGPTRQVCRDVFSVCTHSH